VSAAVALRAEAEASGVRLRLAGDGKVRASGAPLELLARLREHKAELAELLAGHLCKHCGEAMNWPAPVGRIFGDGTGAHHACHERAEVTRIRARADNALSPAALADEAEVTVRGEELP
jgi:hypothetical protein